MNLEVLPRRVIEHVDRRALAGFRFVDAVTRSPVSVPAIVEVRRALLPGAAQEVLLPERAVRIVMNRRGVYAILEAPLFGAYTGAFDDPQPPAETQAGPLRLRVSVREAGPQYLPQEFLLDLPRPLDPAAEGNVFEPQEAGLFRAPSAPVLDGWAVLRVHVTRAGTNPPEPLPGVLLRAFRIPRTAGDTPLGMGMTDWRGGTAGEALVPVANIQRFRPGSGQDPVETDEPIAFEATRDTRFTGAEAQLPDVARLLAGTGEGLIRPPTLPPGSQLEMILPATLPPLRVEAGREYPVALRMP